MPTPGVPDRLILLVARMFPAVWRRRYESEFLALVGVRSATWRDVADVLATCMLEHATPVNLRAAARETGRLALGSLRAYCAAMVCVFTFHYAASLVYWSSVTPLPADAFTVSSLAAAAAYMLRFFIVVHVLLALVAIGFRAADRGLPRGWARAGLVLAIVAFATVIDSWFLGTLGVGISLARLDQIFAGSVSTMQAFVWIGLIDWPALGRHDDEGQNAGAVPRREAVTQS